jgi:hypothetical protein
MARPQWQIPIEGQKQQKNPHQAARFFEQLVFGNRPLKRAR